MGSPGDESGLDAGRVSCLFKEEPCGGVGVRGTRIWVEAAVLEKVRWLGMGSMICRFGWGLALGF